MRKVFSFALAVAGAGVLSGAAFAAATTFSGSATLRGGYGNNPDFNGSDREGNSPVIGGTLNAALKRDTGKGSTTLTGTADVTDTTGDGHVSQNYAVQLLQAEQFSSRLSGSASVGYADTTNPGANYSTDSRDLVPIGDVISIGSHTRTVNGGVNAGYQMDERNFFQVGAFATHTSYSNALASDYTQYGAQFAYMRTISGNTSLGVQFAAMRVNSDLYSSTTSYTAGLVLNQKISRIWHFTGGINAVSQKAFGGTYHTIGFNATLCGDYTRLTVCALASRQSSASGLGGLRIDTQGGARVNYKVTEHSSVDLEANYDISKARSGLFPTEHYFDAGGSYRRTITPRLSGGFSARYQRRTFGDAGPFNSGRTTSYVGTADLVYNFGRTS